MPYRAMVLPDLPHQHHFFESFATRGIHELDELALSLTEFAPQQFATSTNE